MEKSRRKKNNAGMSLVEVVVVVLIMGILSAGAVLGFTFIRNRDASSAAEALVTALNRAKLQTTASGSGEDIKLQVVAESDGYYGRILKVSGGTTTEIDKVEIGDSVISIASELPDGTRTSISGSSPCEITYQKSNGAYTSPYIKLIVSGSKTITVRMVTSTGRCYIE